MEQLEERTLQGYKIKTVHIMQVEISGIYEVELCLLSDSKEFNHMIFNSVKASSYADARTKAIDQYIA